MRGGDEGDFALFANSARQKGGHSRVGVDDIGVLLIDISADELFGAGEVGGIGGEFGVQRGQGNPLYAVLGDFFSGFAPRRRDSDLATESCKLLGKCFNVALRTAYSERVDKH